MLLSVYWKKTKTKQKTALSPPQVTLKYRYYLLTYLPYRHITLQDFICHHGTGT